MKSFINNKDFSEYKATLLHREITPVTINTFDEWIDGAINPIELKESTYSYSKITLKYFVEGDDEQGTLLNVSQLVKAHIKGILSFDDLDISYNVKIDNYDSKQIKDKYYEVTFILKSDFKLTDSKSVTLDSSGEIECLSNVDTPATVSIENANKGTPNKLKIVTTDSNGVEGIVASNGVITFSGTPTSTWVRAMDKTEYSLPAGNYVLSRIDTSYEFNFRAYYDVDNYDEITIPVDAYYISFNLPNEVQYIRLTFKEIVNEVPLEIVEKIQLETGLTPTEWVSPYSEAVTLYNVIVNINDNDYKIDTLDSGEVVVIDGNEYLVSRNGKADISGIELWEFPTLKSGTNKVEINQSGVNVNINYIERFI